MTKEEKELSLSLTNLIEKVETYIKSNPIWIYYFLNPLAGGNEELFDCMKEHPNDWEYYIDFYITNVFTNGASITITIDDGTELGTSLRRSINLNTFADTVERNKKIYDGKLNEIKVKTLKEEKEKKKKILERKEKELKAYE